MWFTPRTYGYRMVKSYKKGGGMVTIEAPQALRVFNRERTTDPPAPSIQEIPTEPLSLESFAKWLAAFQSTPSLLGEMTRLDDNDSSTHIDAPDKYEEPQLQNTSIEAYYDSLHEREKNQWTLGTIDSLLEEVEHESGVSYSDLNHFLTFHLQEKNKQLKLQYMNAAGTRIKGGTATFAINSDIVCIGIVTGKPTNFSIHRIEPILYQIADIPVRMFIESTE